MAFFCCLPFVTIVKAADHGVCFKTNVQTGAINEITIDSDSQSMNWILKTDGSQYRWIKENYGWGLGYFMLDEGNGQSEQSWEVPVSMQDVPVYQAGNIRIRVVRSLDNGCLNERYIFTNTGKSTARLSGMGIYTPFNDNYPDAVTCIRSRAHAHIWEGGSAAYVNAMRMGGTGPHLGLVLTEGSVECYDQWERGREKGNSHTRGVLALCPEDVQLRPGQSYSVAWTLFSYVNRQDFFNKLLELGSVYVTCNKYVFEAGETAQIALHSRHPLQDCQLLMNGTPLCLNQEEGKYVAEARMDRPGEVRFEFRYGNGKRTHANCLVYASFDDLILKRTDFIRTRQQMNEPTDTRRGAYMVYDNEKDVIYKNNTPNCNPVDRDEGAERVGMGVLLAKQYLLTRQPELKESLLRYAEFIRHRLQTKDYVTYSSVDKTGRNRAYNYAWVAEFYFHMYNVTKDKQYASDGYQTLMSMFRQFGHNFYAIGFPVSLGLNSLKEAGMDMERNMLQAEFIKTGNTFVRNGVNYPKSEVNYEQAIVAPSLDFLLQLYQETGVQAYWDEVVRQMPVLEAFNGLQPSYHLHDISIRHWDGFWFGKREMFGDTMPHYWSTITAVAFHLYARCTGDLSYQERAENIVRNNLCLFSGNGKASCAYLYPRSVNGVKAQFYDEYANDQDWALVNYLLVNKDL